MKRKRETEEIPEKWKDKRGKEYGKNSKRKHQRKRMKEPWKSSASALNMPVL